MDLKVMSKAKMKELLEINEFLNNPEKIEGNDIAIISVIDPGKERLIPHNLKNVLVLEFPDIDDADASNSFNYEEDVITFIKKHKNKSMFFVHCTAGVSRSGGIGMFIRDFYLNEYEKQYFDRFHKHLTPNALVYRRLVNAYQERPKYNKKFMSKKEKKTIQKLKKQNLI